ncbi:unnamed protein product [Ilex paraguariensis]|uniref:C3H1-type domain-containing protein n=1 Tax=Ilex paraguariensis TaxID=185542 RepID=A0ABC8SCJ7_9AQUA
MGSVCAEQNKFQPSHQLFLTQKTLREIDITSIDMFMDSPKADETLLQKFLPSNNYDDDHDDDSDPYASDHFRMYEFKVRRCTRSRSHDWTDCPFAHPGEKARRRDPRRYHYSGTVCSEYRRGICTLGDNCEFAHGVFECWLHPSRYRTEACKDSKNCKRKVCFFAHSPRQLRVLPSNCNENASSPVNSPVSGERKYHKANHCCVYCHTSPTSTLMGISHFSPPLSQSPPLSPIKAQVMSGYSPISRYSDRMLSVDSCGLNRLSQFNNGSLSYKDVLTELMSSLETMNVNEASHASDKNRKLSWVDVNFNGDDQQQFILSPSTPSPSGFAHFLAGDCSSRSFVDDKFNESGLADPDLGWVNDLLT